MRQITAIQVTAFMSMLGLSIALGVGSAYALLGSLSLGDFRGIVLVLAGVVFIYLWAFVIYRLFLLALPLEEGEVKAITGDKDEWWCPNPDCAIVDK